MVDDETSTFAILWRVANPIPKGIARVVDATADPTHRE
jgi:hypothetical protein